MSLNEAHASPVLGYSEDDILEGHDEVFGSLGGEDGDNLLLENGVILGVVNLNDVI
jgi:hypothetical protein